MQMTFVPGNTALPSINATTAAKNIISTVPAATAIVHNASIIKAASGWKHSLSDACPATTSCSPLPSLSRFGPSAAPTKRPHIAQCSMPQPALSKNWPKIRASSAPSCQVLPPCSTPGEDRCSIIPICTSSSRLADCPPTERSGCQPATPSICPSEPYPRYSEPNSRPKWQGRGCSTKSILQPGKSPGTSTVRP